MSLKLSCGSQQPHSQDVQGQAERRPNDSYDSHQIESDYGTDLEDDIIEDLLARAHSQSPDELALTHLEQDPVTEHAVIHISSSGQISTQNIEPKVDSTITISAEVDYSSIITSADRQIQSTVGSPTAEVVDDTKSPLERFRTHPKKPLSVTDIVSPAWCEQQYLFSLSKHGRVRRTPAMKQGSKVHKVLEEQVHTTVRIEVKSREDMFGLKLWNVIQGLRTLCSTGVTRELEVWGVLDGEVINGVIDELTTTCPDETLEAKMLGTDAHSKQLKLDKNQTTLSSFVTSQKETPVKRTSCYLVDVKTRQSRTVPTSESQLRPTQMQLMLYHQLLSALANNEVDKNAIFSRYGLDGARLFSDTFIAEIGKLQPEAFDNIASTASTDGSKYEDSVSELLAHNTLGSLWSHMIDVLASTFGKTTFQLSALLAAEFRAAADGSLLGKKAFLFDAEKLRGYVQDELRWWKGERSTKGVEIEEAFKCRMCEFADDCDWRKAKVEQDVARTRQQRAKSQQASNG